MSKITEKMSVGKPVQMKTEAGRPALDVDYPSLEESLQRAETKYERDRADYFNTLADEPVLLSKTKRWQKSARDYMQWAGALFNADKFDNDSRKHAMEIMDRITKESGIRHRNMWKHGDLRIAQAEESNEKTPQELETLKEEMDRAEYETGGFFRSAVKTQVYYGELFEKGETYVSPRQEMEREAAARCQELRDHVLPKDHVYIPGRIIPPHPVPRG